MEYKYYNQFNLSKKLANSISSIISHKENGDYVCTILVATIPERKGLVFQSPLTDSDICRPGAMALNSAQIQAINQKYGTYIEGTIAKEEYPFLVVMESAAYQIFAGLSFSDRREIEKSLSQLSIYYEKYFGSFDVRNLIQSFSYLQEFFTFLDNWRAKMGRVTLDDDVIESGIQKVISNTIQNVSK